MKPRRPQDPRAIHVIANEIVDFAKTRWERQGWDARTVALGMQTAAAGWTVAVLTHVFAEQRPMTEAAFESVVRDFRLAFMANIVTNAPDLMPIGLQREYDAAVLREQEQHA